ncbi:nitroreductase [Peribacillus loiseleuriae]|uniref:nitroreductase family protein n=1 Tax=Peribacillus loiseleuriae TaxID=1679170 RepID=UPI0037FF0C34
MSLSTIIKERRTVKRYKDTPVSVELIQDLLETAVWAPNHKMTQPWRFIFVQGDSLIALAEAAQAAAMAKEKDPAKKEAAGQREFNKISTPPSILLAVMKEDPNPVTREEDFAAISCVIHNFTLLAWEQGLGTFWATYATIFAKQFREACGVQPGEKIVGSIHVGYPDMIPNPRERKSIEEVFTVL